MEPLLRQRVVRPVDRVTADDERRSFWTGYNTDGPGNPLSKVYTAAGMRRAFADFAETRTQVRFLNLRAYPMGERLEQFERVRRLGRRWGWHLWITATK